MAYTHNNLQQFCEDFRNQEMRKKKKTRGKSAVVRIFPKPIKQPR